jgi:trk system potassium uptake protein
MPPRQQSSLLHPTRLIIGAYAVVIVIGTMLLALPLATPGPDRASLETAVFTATSAITVTGLAVVDTATEWTRFGQVVILVLIQLGGFGITTFASVFAVLVFRRLGLRARLATQLEQNTLEIGQMRGLIRRIAVFYALVEGVGIVVLTLAFWRSGRGLVTALWEGTFHAISAFNNAGFSTFSDSLSGFAGDGFVLMPVMVLIIVGGIGFPVVLEVLRTRFTFNRWSIHTRLTLATSAALVVLGMVAMALFEWNNPGTLGGLGGAGDRFMNALFASISPRTAGFNTFDYGATGPAAQFSTIALMVIGGGSASAAGGIKVTTFALLAFVILAELRSDSDVNAYGRRISEGTQRLALSVALLGVGSVAVGTLAVSATTPQLAMGDVLFEVASAVGTVGLSTGITPELGTVSRLLMCGLMLLGRLGPATFGIALVLRRRQLLLRFPEGRPLIG